MKNGYFVLVLHTHIPYVRCAGAWPFGEDILHEAIAETYIPLLDAFYSLKQRGVEPKATVGLTPILLEQLRDPGIIDRFEVYVEEKIQAAEGDRVRFEATGAQHFAFLARYYRDFYENVLCRLREAYERDLVGAFRRLQDEGNLDILSSAATHGYLPLMQRDSTIWAQLQIGAQNYRRIFGRPPRGVWLPECAYRPAFTTDAGGREILKPGFEAFLRATGLHYFFTDTPVIAGGRLVGKMAGDVIGPYGGMPARRFVRRDRIEPPSGPHTTFRPYYVESTDVAVFAREEQTGLQVWSAAQGYPGDFQYREFHRRDPVSGLQYWRITDASGDLGRKVPYEPDQAMARVPAHADHFVAVVERRLAEYAGERPNTSGVVVSAYDTELFGHWWFEGVPWLERVLERLADHPTVALATAAQVCDEAPPDEIVALPESSWGTGGGHSTWLNEDTEWMWPLIHNAERQMERLVERYPEPPGGALGKVLEQAGREALLLQASDWPFLVSTGQAKDYATARFQHHLARFNHLVLIAGRGTVLPSDAHFLETIADLDNPFPQMDYQTFRCREGLPLV